VTGSPSPAAASGRGSEVVGWALAAAGVLYVVLIHHGIGPGPVGVELRWYEPRGFLSGWSWLAWAFGSTPRLILVLSLPALALSLAVVATSASAFARALSVSCVFATILFLFYGDQATRVWQWFGWRGSAVIALLSVCIGLSLTAPLLATSWLRLRWPARIAVYAPFALGAIAFLRNATGTDPDLRFNLSPWPAVPIFGLEVAALFIAAWLLGIAVGLRGVAEWRSEPGGRSRLLVGSAVGIALPVALLALGSGLSLFPFRFDRGAAAATALVSAVAIGLAASLGVRGAADETRLRCRSSAVGAAMILLPIVVGQAWSRFDYWVTREQRAREIIEALATWFDREGLYPDELDRLLESGDLSALPRPAIGFRLLDGSEFRYRNFGTSFLLEFPAPRWVECAYTPPFEDETADEGEEIGLAEAWSCPSKPPELW
jgi:hypothetical protein